MGLQSVKEKVGVTNAPTKQKPTTIQGMLKQYQYEIARALPKHIDPDRMTRIALTEIRRTPDLLKCEPASLFGAVIQASQLGLEPGGALGQCYLLPFRDNKNNRTDVQFIVGYRGMLDLARRSGQIVSINAHEVYEEDTFNFEYGLHETLRHIPARGDRGQLIGVYAIAHLKDGGHQIEVMWKEDVDRIKATSKSANSKYSPWNTHYAEMAKKTVIRRLFKYLPVSVEMMKATAMDEQAEDGINQNNADLLLSDDDYIVEVDDEQSSETGEEQQTD